jgi:hypothetical protein
MSSSFIYQGVCIPKSCLLDKLSRVRLTPLNDFTTNIGKLQMSIVYQAKVVEAASGFQYHVTILYGDQTNNQLVSDPINCIDWRLYQTANAFDVNPSRLSVAQEGALPAWPKASYQYNQQSSAGQI